MSELDRRTMIGLAAAAGGGLVLSGCGKKPQPALTPVGYCDLAGQSVRDLAPSPLGPITAFSPTYICIVYMKFASDLTMTIRRTYIGPLSPTAKPSPSQVESMVGVALAKFAAGQPYNQYDKEDIDPIGMGTQQILVIYLDNPENKIRFKYDPADSNSPTNNASYDLTIRFVKFSSKGSGDQRHDNHAYFNIMKMNIVKSGTVLQSGTAFRLDYWNTNEMGHVISGVTNSLPATYFLHSMNIHFEVSAPLTDGTVKWLPLIIDPDTGNMGMQP